MPGVMSWPDGMSRCGSSGGSMSASCRMRGGSANGYSRVALHISWIRVWRGLDAIRPLDTPPGRPRSHGRLHASAGGEPIDQISPKSRSNVQLSADRRAGDRISLTHGTISTGAHLAFPNWMARIRTSRRGGATCVTVTGKLTATDLGRFEHACAPALTAPAAALHIDLRGVTDLDRIADVFLRHMLNRGARICCPAHLVVTPTDPVQAAIVRDRDGA
jgi:hypothetical protein